MLRLDPRSCLTACLLVLWNGAALAVDPRDTLLLEQPDISERHITFIYDGDVWVANRDGTGAYRLTTAEGEESLPHFSPDGASIAFSGNYDGNIDVYVVPVAGGSPKRLTWHSADDLVEGFESAGSHRLQLAERRVFRARRAPVRDRPERSVPRAAADSAGCRCRRLARRSPDRLCADSPATAMERPIAAAPCRASRS